MDNTFANSKLLRQGLSTALGASQEKRVRETR